MSDTDYNYDYPDGEEAQLRPVIRRLPTVYGDEVERRPVPQRPRHEETPFDVFEAVLDMERMA